MYLNRGEYLGKSGWSVIDVSEMSTFCKCIATVTLHHLWINN